MARIPNQRRIFRLVPSPGYGKAIGKYPQPGAGFLTTNGLQNPKKLEQAIAFDRYPLCFQMTEPIVVIQFARTKLYCFKERIFESSQVIRGTRLYYTPNLWRVSVKG